MKLIVLPLLVVLLQAPSQENPKDLQAVFDTSAGNFIVQFYPDQSPNHVRKFIELAREGYFNGTSFHSMVARAVVQGGDPETKNPNARDKFGSGGYNMGLKREISDLPMRRGTIAAFTVPGVETAGSQFFICVGDQLQMNGQYTAFAYVADGMDIVEKISSTPTDDKRMATERVEVKSVTVRKIPPPPPPVAPPFTTETIEELRTSSSRLKRLSGRSSWRCCRTRRRITCVIFCGSRHSALSIKHPCTAWRLASSSRWAISTHEKNP